ncbi:MAG: hypothetical protein CMD73_01990 [Gammaproteobacteria bacterium]|jgi:uncharacterized protein YbaR (Trm112 family)|nr:hypothetical protein [Gammaproteobacteria bacterium]|tara:strand:+ start:195 stop:380 length:186 start_codon:yes stop_codon:yes gene_type:complete
MDKFLLDILVCPKSGYDLVLLKKTNELICKESNLAYPIKNGIPILLVDEARELKPNEIDDI